MSDTDLYALLQLVAGRHGWAIRVTPEPTDTGLAQAALPPTTMAPPAGQQPQLNRAPAALGAPPGEEAFPPQAPTVPVEAFMQFEGSVTTETPNYWSSLQGPSPTARRLRPCSFWYLNEFYSVQPDTAEQQPRASMLFRSGTEPDPGIPFTADFKREYARIARAPLPKGAPPTRRHAFLFQPGDTEKYLAPEKLSPEVLALGEHVAQGNPLRRKQFLDEDRRWTHVSSLVRSSMRLAAYRRSANKPGRAGG